MGLQFQNPGEKHAMPSEHNQIIQVMLVNDLPIVAWGLERLIESQRPRLGLVGTASSHDEALSMLDSAPADVILVDLDGGNPVQGISGLLDRAHLKVLALTSSPDTRLADSAMLAGASGIVSKSEPVGVLLKAIEDIHAGEICVDLSTARRIFLELSRRKHAEHTDPERQKITLLTRRERLVVAEVAHDAASMGRDIAQRLHISENTLRNHLSSIYAKLGLGSRLELYAYAHRHELT